MPTKPVGGGTQFKVIDVLSSGFECVATPPAGAQAIDLIPVVNKNYIVLQPQLNPFIIQTELGMDNAILAKNPFFFTCS